VAYLVVTYFPHCLVNYVIFAKKKVLNTQYVFWFSLQLLSKKYLIPRIIQRDLQHLVFVTPLLLSAAIVEELELV